MNRQISNRIRHFFHVLSNVRPIYWLCMYLALVPLFALLYWALPDAQFRIPDGSTTDFGSWLYYSIVTITTLGFGDYTPAHGWAQAVTAVEVMLGLVMMGLFLNAVGAMKSEIDVESEIEKQRRLHAAAEKDKLKKSIPLLLHTLNSFLAYCYAITTPATKRTADGEYNPDFSFSDLRDLYQPANTPDEHGGCTCVEGFLETAGRTSLTLDTLQSRIDLTLWPNLLEDCFGFVANYQMFTGGGHLSERMTRLLPDGKSMSLQEAEAKISEEIARHNDPTEVAAQSPLAPVVELYHLIKDNGKLAMNLETILTEIASAADEGEAS